MKVLIVDDDENILRLCKVELQEQGYEIVTASTGAAAMERFRKEFPDLVVLDIKLPDTDGLALLDLMKETRHDVPVIMHTTFDHVYDLACSASDGYVLKSADFKDLKNAIRRVIRDGGKPGAIPDVNDPDASVVTAAVKIREEHMDKLRALGAHDERSLNKMIDEALFVYLRTRKA